jgi:thioredoxin 1
MRAVQAAILAVMVLFLFTGTGVCVEPDDPKAFIEAAKESGAPLFVDVGSHGCAACKKMVPVLASIEKRFEGKLLVVFVDAEKHRSYARSLGVMAIPTQIFFDKTGSEVGRNIGYIPEDDAVGMMRDKGVVE